MYALVHVISVGELARQRKLAKRQKKKSNPQPEVGPEKTKIEKTSSVVKKGVAERLEEAEEALEWAELGGPEQGYDQG